MHIFSIDPSNKPNMFRHKYLQLIILHFHDKS
jgi:hypothetical protein